MSKITLVIRRSIYLAAFWLLLPLAGKAAVCDQDSILNFIARDPNGSYISGAKVDVYKQTTDANGQAKPGSRVGGGTVDASLGRARVSWRNSEVSTGTYAVRVQTISKDSASFWYYDYQIGCGEEKSASENLSGLNFVLREADGDPLVNTSFTVYSQLRDSSGSLLNAKDEQIAGLNSGSSGSVRVYLPQGSVRSLERNRTDYYVMEISRGSLKTTLYNLYVADGSLNTVSFYISRFRLRLQDSQSRGAVGAKVEVYKQETDIGYQNKRGDKVGEFTIGTDGYGYIDLMPGTYVLGVKGENNEYQYFWDTVISNSQTNERNAYLSASFNSSGTCSAAANLNITLKTAGGTTISGLKYEVYEQETDSSGLPIAGKKIGSGTTDAVGRGKVNFKPGSQKVYALKVWDKRSDMGEYWFFNAARFVCGYDRDVTKAVPVLRVVWRDSNGELKRNFSFSLWAQKYDADGKPILADNGKIADLKTDGGGQAYAYVSPFNAYRPGQTGTYAITAKDSSGNTVTFFNVTVPEDRDLTYTAQTSGLSGQLQDARNRSLGNKEIKIYQQSGRSLGQMLTRAKTDASGNFSFEYPAGTYAISATDDFNQESIFWDVAVKSGSGSAKLVMNLTNISLTAANGEELPNEPTIRLYSLAGSGSSYFRDKEVGNFRLGSGKTALKTLAAGPYLVVYTGKGDKEYGAAFYAASGQFQNIGIQVSAKGLVNPGQNYRLSVPSSSNTGSGSGTAASAGVKGRILLQVEDKGQAWYVSPVDGKRYSLGRPDDAFAVMRELGLGVSNQNFSSLQSNPSAWRQLAGRILLKVEDKGKAYYFDPVKLELHYLGRPADAFAVMRQLGLGITNSNLSKITIGK